MTTDTADDPAVSGATWAAFCDSLKATGDKVLEHSTDELDRLEGFRVPSRLTRASLQASRRLGRTAPSTAPSTCLPRPPL